MSQKLQAENRKSKQETSQMDFWSLRFETCLETGSCSMGIAEVIE